MIGRIAIPAKRDESFSDVLLAARAAMGDPADQRRFLDRVFGRVHKTATYLAHNPSDRDDLVQCALVQILRSVSGFRAESSLDRWVDRVTVQTAAKQFEKNDRRRKLDKGRFAPEPYVSNQEETANLARIRQRLIEVFSSLSAHHRIPVVLHYLYDYEVAEISELTGTKVNTVRGRLREGIKRARNAVLLDPILAEWVEEVQRR